VFLKFARALLGWLVPRGLNVTPMEKTLMKEAHASRIVRRGQHVRPYCVRKVQPVLRTATAPRSVPQRSAVVSPVFLVRRGLSATARTRTRTHKVRASLIVRRSVVSAKAMMNAKRANAVLHQRIA